MNYLKQIKEYVPKTKEEIKDKEMILYMHSKIGDEILNRSSLACHMSSSGLVVNHDFSKILMIYHNIYKSWSWTGGHADGEEDLFSVALREVEEETGAKDLKEISKDIISLEVLPVKSHIKRGEVVSNHLHMNVTYVFIGNEQEKLRIKEDENSGVKWIDVNRLDEFVSEKEMIPVYLKIIKQAKEVMKLS